MIAKNDSRYALDLHNLMDFVFESEYDRTNDSEITETYVSDDVTKDLVLINKQLREVKGNDNSAKFTIRYDLVKMLIDVLINTEPGVGTNFGEDVIFNTLFAENLIKEINE